MALHRALARTGTPVGECAGGSAGVAREVAHGSERLNAPLSTYVAGRYVASRVAAGADEAAALAEVEQAVKRVLAEDSST